VNRLVVLLIDVVLREITENVSTVAHEAPESTPKLMTEPTGSIGE